MSHQDIETRTISFNGYKEYYFTVNKLKKIGRLIERLKEKKIRITKIFFLGQTKDYDLIKEELERYPCVLIGNSRLIKNKYKKSSLMICAVSGNISSFQYLKTRNKLLGVCFSSPSGRHLLLSGIESLWPNKQKSFLKIASGAYKNLDRIIISKGFSLFEVYRFWNFLSDISNGYLPFNQARDKYFSRNKLSFFPAATGIEARLLNNQAISLSLEAIEPKKRGGILKMIVSSKKQSEPRAYGPKFSRAILLKYRKDKIEKLFISGTSSVDKNGRSVWARHIPKNVHYVMNCFYHLLKKNNLGWKNIANAIVYCKNDEAYKQFKIFYEKRNLDFPYNVVFTLICRSDFLFEIEAVASNKVKREEINYL